MAARDISIHALLAESDLNQIPPRRFHYHFYPRSPCGERRCLRCCAISCITISIHALLAESDSIFLHPLVLISLFLSTLSLRRATAHTVKKTSIAGHFYPRSPCGERLSCNANVNFTTCISIHALLAESDLRKSPPMCSIRHFYPRSPCGERRGACARRLALSWISIHALLAESDRGGVLMLS